MTTRQLRLAASVFIDSCESSPTALPLARRSGRGVRGEGPRSRRNPTLTGLECNQ
jgi:hypothetical protein